MNETPAVNEPVQLKDYVGTLRHYRAIVVVDEDRYNGAYSHAAYTAWWGLPPDDIDDGDNDCDAFWFNNPDVLCGKGSTPQAAFNDLKAKVEERFLFEPKFADVPSAKYGVSIYMLHDSPEFVTWLEQPFVPWPSILSY